MLETPPKIWIGELLDRRSAQAWLTNRFEELEEKALIGKHVDGDTACREALANVSCDLRQDSLVPDPLEAGQHEIGMFAAAHDVGQETGILDPSNRLEPGIDVLSLQCHDAQAGFAGDPFDSQESDLEVRVVACQRDERCFIGQGFDCLPADGGVRASVAGSEKRSKTHDSAPLVEIPIDEPLSHVDHGVDDELDEASVEHSGAFPRLVVAEKIAHLPLAVGAGGAHVLLRLWLDTVGKGFEKLAELQASGNPGPPGWEVERLADGESGSAPTAVVVDAVGLHLAETRCDLPEDVALRLDDPH